jgi:hypothetical protein
VNFPETSASTHERPDRINGTVLGKGDNFINVCISINISKFKICIMFNSTTVVSTGY